MPSTKRTASGVLGGLTGLIGLSAVAGVLVTATVTPAIAVTSYAASSAITMFDNMPSYLAIDKLMLPTTMYAMDYSTGQYMQIAEFYDQNRSPVEFDGIAPIMNDAILSSEDPRYYEHGGVDLLGTTRALLNNAGGGQTQGGSTISQQYVKNILIQRCEADAEPGTDELQACWSEATTAEGNSGYERKLQEMRYAIQLEKEYTKDEILLGYLNIANFGGTTYGIDAAAKRYYSTSAAALTLGQAAALAGIVQNPNTYRIDRTGGSVTYNDGTSANGEADGYKLTKGRQVYVLDRMLSDGKITQEQHDAAVAEPITPVVSEAQTGCAAAGIAAYFCQYVKGVIENDVAFGDTRDERLEALKRGGLSIYTTLDLRLQSVAQQTMLDWAPSSIPGYNFGAAAVSVETTTGRVLSMVQNTNFSEDKNLSESTPGYTSLVYGGNYRYGGSVGFGVGSTFKLFTLIDWLEKDHSINESVDGRNKKVGMMTNSCGGGDWYNGEGWRPSNYDKVPGYIGSPMQFTAQSLNTGYVAMAQELDLCDIRKVATKMGVTTVVGGVEQEVTIDGGAAVLGDANVSPLAMAGAYGTVANNGVYCQPKVIDVVANADGEWITAPASTCTEVIPPNVAATAAYALQGVMTGGGTGAASNPRDGTAVLGKTGTNEQYNTWMVESSTAVATAVWVGNSLGFGDLYDAWHEGVRLDRLRHQIAPVIQRTADELYPGVDFTEPDPKLLRVIYADLPNVVGRSIADATEILEDAGFDVRVGDPIDSSGAEGTVAEQSPGAGSTTKGALITIRPSNGQGASIPWGLVGLKPGDAQKKVQAAGFTSVDLACVENKEAEEAGTVVSVSPEEGSSSTKSAAVTITFEKAKC